MKQSCPHLENSWQRQTGRGRRDGGGGGLLGNTGAGGLAPAAGGWHSGWGGEASAYRQLGGGGCWAAAPWGWERALGVEGRRLCVLLGGHTCNSTVSSAGHTFQGMGSQPSCVVRRAVGTVRTLWPGVRCPENRGRRTPLLLPSDIRMARSGQRGLL